MIYRRTDSEYEYDRNRAASPDTVCCTWPDDRIRRGHRPRTLRCRTEGVMLWEHLENELPYPCGDDIISFLVLDSPVLTAQTVDLLPVGSILPASGSLAFLWCDCPESLAQDVYIHIIAVPVDTVFVGNLRLSGSESRKTLRPRVKGGMYERSHFVIYDGCKVFRQIRKSAVTYERYPATTKDIWQFRPQSAGHEVFKAVFAFFAKKNKMWKDAYADFVSPSAYGAIPLVDIWECHNKKELFTKNYGYSANRANKDSFGQSIFLARASRFVSPEDLQKLYGYTPGQCFIGRRKEEIERALWERTYSMLKAADPGIPDPSPGLYHLFSDYFGFCDRLGEKIEVDITSPAQLRKLHDEAAERVRARQRSWKISPDSPFRNLKLPKGWVSLKRQPELDEEGEFMHHCVATYGSFVKKGISAIISRRIGDERYTAEVRVGKDGKFYIEQFRAFANDPVPPKIWEELKTILKDQKPAGKRRPRRTKAEMEEARANGTVNKPRRRTAAKKKTEENDLPALPVAAGEDMFMPLFGEDEDLPF